MARILDQFEWLWGGGAQPTAAKPQEAPRAEGVPLSSLQSWDQIWNGVAGGAFLSADRAMRLGAVYACVRVIAGTTSSLPFKTFRDVEVEIGPKKEIKRTIPVEAPDHPAAKLLRLRPNPRMSAVMFWRFVISQMLLRGNGYVWIERKRSGRIVALWPIPKERVQPVLSKTSGRLIYNITLDTGEYLVGIDQDDMLHIPGSLEWNGLEAKSPLQSYASSVNIGLEANEYAEQFLKNDATPPIAILYPAEKKLDAKKVEAIKALWQTAGTGDNRGKVRILADGAKVEQLTITAEEAQLLETRKLSREEIAMIVGVPPHMIVAIDKQTSFGTGVEQQSINFVTYTLGMHIAAIVQECEAKIFRDDGHRVSVNVNALMRGDFKTRTEGYAKSLGAPGAKGWSFPNETRAIEGLPPVEGGDELNDPHDPGNAPGAEKNNDVSQNSGADGQSGGGAEPNNGQN